MASNRCSSSYGVEQLRKRCYHEWMCLQAKHIVDLDEALKNQRSNENGREVVGKIVDDYQKYAEKRSELTNRSCSSYVAPSWNSSLENGLLWMGGCRPSSFFRVLFSLSGSQAETQLAEYLLKMDNNDDAGSSSSHHDGSPMSELTAAQLGKINELHMKVIDKEDKLTKNSANLQEDIADMPVSVTAYAMDSVVDAEVTGVEAALDKHEEGMAVLMAEADKLRLETLKKIVEVVTPAQAAEFMLAGKRLHVSLHEWGRVREERSFGCARVEEDVATERDGTRKFKISATCCCDECVLGFN